MYRIEKDGWYDFYRVTIAGFWGSPQRQSFARDLSRLAAPAGHPVVCLVDGRDFPPQSQETLDAISSVVGSLDGRLISFVVLPSALARMQAGRVATDHRERIFPTIPEAEAAIAQFLADR